VAVKLSTLPAPTYRRGARGVRKIAVPVRAELKAKNLFEEEEEKQLLEEVHELFDGTYSVIRPGPWKRAFRPSGFPYCPVLDAMTGPENMDYGKAFYLDIGTTVHALMQEYIARSARGRTNVFANWKCKDCGGEHIFTPIPYVCAFCGADSEKLGYEELAFENAFGIQGGHIDLLVKTSKGWIVGDWKTASEMGMDYRKEADGKHHHQLQAYCLAIQELFKDHLQGLPVIGYMLIFVPRDASGRRDSKGDISSSNWTPYIYKWSPEMAVETKRRLFTQRASYEAASIGYETNNWLPAAWLRPCQTLADFSKPMGMRDGFYQGKLCENLDTCCRSSQEVADGIIKFRSTVNEDTARKTAFINEQKAEYLACAAQGFVAPSLLAELKKARKADDYDNEYVESILAVKASLEALLAIRTALSRQKTLEFFGVPTEEAKAVAAKSEPTWEREKPTKPKRKKAA
jgi:hypothetical protein